MSSELKYRIAWLILFSIAMGFLEAAVVIYLRELYYPHGFSFPLTVMDERVALVELLREAATVIMLAGVGVLAGHSLNQRFAFFLSSFAIWDIFYYVFLKAMIGWPDSLLTWDILFLIPVPWIGPVLAPCIISITMLLLATVLVYKDLQNASNRLTPIHWTMLLTGSFIVVASWTIDFLSYNKTMDNTMVESMSSFVPVTYNWYLFLAGEVILLAAVFLYGKRTSVKR